MTLLVRDASHSDQDALRNLYRATFNAAYGPTLGQAAVAGMLTELDVSGLRSMLPSKDERAAVAVLAGQVVGSTIIAERGRVAYLWGMYVHPAHQRQGIGTMLLQYAMEGLLKAEAVEARVLPSSLWAVAFYGKLGFRQIGREPLEIAPRHTVLSLVMRTSRASLLGRLTLLP